MSVRDVTSLPEAYFVITAERCPHILSRLIGLFAQQNRPIRRVEAVDTGRIVRLTFAVRNLEVRRANILAEKMRQTIMVRTVRVSRKQAAGRCQSKAAQRMADPAACIAGRRGPKVDQFKTGEIF